jgi:hypothetical protein
MPKSLGSGSFFHGRFLLSMVGHSADNFRRPFDLREPLCELCAFAPLREIRLHVARFSQRRKGAKK